MENTNNSKFSMRKFIRTKVNGGSILMIVALVTMIIANSPLKDYYNDFFATKLIIRIGDVNLFKIHEHNLTILSFINDALMAVFFFSIGLEIKREMLVGELSSFKKAMLPVVAAIGGMIIPIVIFCCLTDPGFAAKGAAIPMATDIAFSLGVLSLLGKKVPLSLKIFLTAFAVVDDIGGIAVIGIFYSQDLALSYIMYSLIVLFLMWIIGRMGVHSKLFYLTFGIVVWYLFLNSGIHPTIAGVLVAFVVPAHPKLNIKRYIKKIKNSILELPEEENITNTRMLTADEISTLKKMESYSDHVISPLQSLEDNLFPLINYIIMPLFAFANANVDLSGFSFENAANGVTFDIFNSLVFGKIIGIFVFTWIFTKSKILTLPEGINYKNVFGVAILGGIGFTVSLFIATLSYAKIPEIGLTLLNEAKIGILAGTIFAGIVGYIYLKIVLKEDQEVYDDLK